MTSYMPKDHSLRVGNILYSPTAHASAVNSKSGVGLPVLDTLAECTQQKDSWVKNSALQSELRPTLPQSDSKVPTSELTTLAAAFCKAYSSMTQSIISQTQDFTKLQQLDQTQAAAVLALERDAIDKQAAAEKETADIAEYQKHMANVDKVMNRVLIGIGIGLLVLTALSSLLAGPVALAALPEEVSFEMTELGLAAAAEEAGEDFAGSLAMNALSGEEIAGESLDATALNENVAKKGETTVAKKLARLGIKMGISAGFASPLLVKGISNLHVSDRVAQLSESQKLVGDALASVQKNNMYFQFLQQLLQREGNVAREETKDASEVVETFSTIANAWRAISYGLANTV
jgi:hypothetical protein